MEQYHKKISPQADAIFYTALKDTPSRRNWVNESALPLSTIMTSNF